MKEKPKQDFFDSVMQVQFTEKKSKYVIIDNLYVSCDIYVTHGITPIPVGVHPSDGINLRGTPGPSVGVQGCAAVQ